jgi:hypothetical protein
MSAARAALHETSCSLAWIVGGALFFKSLAFLLLLVNLVVIHVAVDRDNNHPAQNETGLVDYITFQNNGLFCFMVMLIMLALRVAHLLITSAENGHRQVIILCTAMGLVSLCMLFKSFANMALLFDGWAFCGAIKILCGVNILYSLTIPLLWGPYCSFLVESLKHK